MLESLKKLLFPELMDPQEDLTILKIDAENAYGEGLVTKLPFVREALEADLSAALAADPAAESREMVLQCYPGFYALMVHRLAYEVHREGLTMLSRIMAEQAHSCTGIDIHPAATIGSRFFIDHGTGVVIGETAVIGNDVKLYQGVTLGALSTNGGACLRGVKRHPTVEDGVTIYANATILGGNTVIGRGSVIGANTFITTSVPPETRVSIEPKLQLRQKEH